MIRIQISPRRVRHPLPIRTNEFEIISQVRHERRNGKIRSKSKNHRSQKTVYLTPGQVMLVDDRWADLPDVKTYRKKGWILVRPVKDNVSNQVETKPKKTKKRGK